MNAEYVVETSYSGGTFWTYYHTLFSLEAARHLCETLTLTSQGNFKHYAEAPKNVAEAVINKK